MMVFSLVIHAFICLVLISTILIQRGKGGGFVEAFSGLESMLGTKTNAFLSKLTSVFATLFIVSCLWLAFLSLTQSRSLMRGVQPVPLPANATATMPAAPQVQETPAVPVQETSQPPAPAAAVNQTAP